MLRLTTHLLCCCLIMMFSSPVFSSESNSHALSRGERITRFNYIQDASRNLDLRRAVQQFTQGAYKTVSGQAFNIGNSDDVYWIKFSIGNDTQKSQNRRLVFGAPFVPLLNAYLVTDGEAPQTLMKHDGHQVFSMRVNDAIKLNSIAFDLPAGSRVDVFIQYQPRGMSFLPISVETNAKFFNRSHYDAVQAAIFYSFCLAVLLSFLFFGVAMHSRLVLFYAALFLQYVFFMAIIEGYAFKYFWPDWPQWNIASGLVVSLVLVASGFLLSSIAIENIRFYKVFRLCCMSLSLFCLALLLIIPFSGNAFLMLLIQILMTLMFISQGYCIYSWLAYSSKRNQLAFYAALIMIAVMFYAFTVFLNSAVLAEWMVVSFNRFVYLFISLITLGTFSIHLAGLRRDHEKSLQNELENAKRDAELNRALFESEQRYSEARALANKRQMQLAAASHDIRQPLMSLRSTIDVLSKEQNPSSRTQLHNAFQYIEELCNHYLTETRPETENKTEVYSVSLITDTISKMFRQEAIDKGLELHVVSSSVELSCPPMPLIRVVSNFVSNAIKHCNEGKIVVGCRRSPGQLRIDVYDNGPGINAQELDILQQPYQKGEHSQGEGLGLAITKELADSMGWSISMESNVGKGSRFSVMIPVK
jgi:signal transduction histidine kinase